MDNFTLQIALKTIRNAIPPMAVSQILNLLNDVIASGLEFSEQCKYITKLKYILENTVVRANEHKEVVAILSAMSRYLQK